MNTPQRVHILGITGHAMRGVALALKKRGHIVTGTDPDAYPPGSDWLDGHSITWWREPDIKHLEGVDMVILGGGVSPEQPELVEAVANGIEIKSYPQAVWELIKSSHRVVVTGSHGKTTTTSMIAWILEYSGKHPDFLVGIQPHNFNTSVRLEGSEVAVIEGDEYRSSQLDNKSKFDYYHPNVVIITSIEYDHPDLFPDFQSVEQRFINLVGAMSHDGRVYVCGTSTEAMGVAAKSAAPITTYGPGSFWQARDIEYGSNGLVYKLFRHDEELGIVHLPLYGEHNVTNSLAASAVAIDYGVEFGQLQKAFSSFKGASRRFERVSTSDSSVIVIDDYAHHPTEVAATIKAAKQHFKGKVIVVFRPHTYSRILALKNDFREALELADRAFVAPIEGAREGLVSSVSGADIVQGARAEVVYEADRNRLIEQVSSVAGPGDVVLCMSVNGYDQVAQELAAKITLKQS